MEDSPMDKIMKKRLDNVKELDQKWVEFYTYVRPFIQSNDEIEKLAHDIKLRIMFLPVDDLILITAMAAEKLALNSFKSNFCLSCQKKIEEEEK